MLSLGALACPNGFELNPIALHHGMAEAGELGSEIMNIGHAPLMLTKVTRLEKLGNFRLRIRFNDGSGGVHDFAAMVNEPGSLVAPFREETYFECVFLEFGAPTWPNGFDIAPEWLRREMIAAGELTHAAAE